MDDWWWLKLLCYPAISICIQAVIDFKIDSPIYIISWFPMYICLPHWLAAALIPYWCCCNLWNWHINIFKRCCNVSSCSLVSNHRQPCWNPAGCSAGLSTPAWKMAIPSTLSWCHQDSYSNICIWHLLPGLALLAPCWPCWMLLLPRTRSLCICVGVGKTPLPKAKDFFENRHLGKHVRCEASLCVVFCCFCLFFQVCAQSN